MTDTEIQQNPEEEAKIARGERLTRVRGMANLSRADVEKQYGIPANTIKNWESGRNTGLTEIGAKRVLMMFQKAGVQCSVGWLLHGTGIQPALLNTNTTAHNRDVALSKEIAVFCEYHTNALWIQVTDDGMEPYYTIGDYVAGERHYQAAIQATIGKQCIVETQAGEIFLRLVREGSKEGYYSLHCINTFTAVPEPLLYDIELASAAPVIWHRRITTEEAARQFPDNP